MPSKGNSPFKPMKDIKIGEKDVEKALNRLNPSKATGSDKVPVRILKETANYHRTYSYTKLSTVRRSTQTKYQRIGKMPT